ncbi:SRPBCC family protein [Cryobacterium psychrophilum]|uniref:SRPBCC domain-containing protein n=1 Tax=Cryobacterium psychrophilum TaxID=41988 RepID=A0A4Y8KQR3_9MICO|nr:SRPBCC domain-containing protein [Cryobacterium psychrophilum]TDW30274.1 hypothetical protein EDD25_2023 [Cryobacterium psychrophilum]TFD77493.1 SRPBCC domain-containing protein [Cryobacterium psychrophilum]
MGRQFEVVFEGEFPGTPEQVWEAITTQTAAWLFPSEGMEGTDLVSERPTHRVNRMDGPDGWFNQLDQVIEERPDGRSFMRWVHSGVSQDDRDPENIAVNLHTAFYMHTLAEYLEHFVGRPAVFADIQGPEASTAPESFEIVRAALGIDVGTVAGDSTYVALPGEPAPGAFVDYTSEHFIGLRTNDALYRFFGRNAFGGPVGITVHHFGGAEPILIEHEWHEWILDLFT